MAISIIEHSAALTHKIVSVFDEKIPVRGGFMAWFPRETTASLLVDTRVRRGTRRIAVDVLRFTEGNKTKMTRLTENLYQPPFYREEYDFNRDMIYMNSVALGGVTGSPTVNKMIASNAVKALEENRDSIERAIQKQQSEVLQTGIITLINGDNIDFRRKAASMVDVDTTGDYWSVAATAKPLDDIAAAGVFLRDVGNSSGNVLNVVMRSSAMNAFFATTQVKEQADIRWIERVNVGMPQFENTTGFTYNGQIGGGDFVINLWTYNEMYEDDNGVSHYYLDNDNVIVLPEDFRGKTVFGGLPTLADVSVGGVSTKQPAVVEAEYLLRGYYDEKTISSTLELTSAPIVIPEAVDKIYTMKVLA